VHFQKSTLLPHNSFSKNNVHEGVACSTVTLEIILDCMFSFRYQRSYFPLENANITNSMQQNIMDNKLLFLFS
jgi:hypothetical protein